MKFKTVALLGAGAVGSYIISGLANKEDIDFFLVADGERKARLEKDGVIINDVTFHPAVKTPEEARGADLLIVTVKYTALESALDDIKTITDENTTIISLLNGVDSEDIIGDAVGHEHLVHSLIKIAAERKGNSIHFDPDATIGVIFGEKNRRRCGDREEALSSLFEGTGLKYRCSDNIMYDIWSKFLLNVTMNQPQAMIGVGIGANKDSEHVAFIERKLREEVLAIALANGIDLVAAGMASTAFKALPRARYSTLQDLDAKRKTEVDVFAGAVVKMGRELGIPTPYNEFTLHMIKALEEKNNGLFNYD